MSDQRCQWCGEPATGGDTNCRACGAALPLVGPVDDLRIPGVTDVDPELKLSAKLPRRVVAGSPTQGMAAGAIGAAAAMGGIGSVAALGALAAVAANEYKGAAQTRQAGAGTSLEVGQPSEAALEMARKLRERETTDKTPGG
jgi:hypothetical protein